MRSSATAGRPVIDRVTPEDLTSLVTDVGSAPMQVGAILFLDTTGGFDVAAARDTIEERVRAIPRLRQRLQPTPPGCGRPIWVDHAGFDIVQHVSIEPTRQERGLEGALARAADLVAARLPRDRPMWTARFVPVDSDTTALVVVFHHVLADGIGGLAVLAGLVDGVSDAPAPVFPRPVPSAALLAVGALRDRAQSVVGLCRVPHRIVEAMGELRASGRTRASHSSLNRPTGARRRIATTSVDLATIVEVAHAAGGSVNDVVLSAVDGALERLLESRGEHNDRFVVSVPVSRRERTTARDLGNQVGVAPIELPCVAGRHERLRMIAARGARVRSAPRGASAELLGPAFRALARLRLFQWFIDRQRLVNSFVTNLRGPDTRLTFCGAPVTGLLPIAGISGNVTVAFAVMSYAGTLAVTIIADPDAVPDLQVLRDALQGELDAHAILARRDQTVTVWSDRRCSENTEAGPPTASSSGTQ